MYDIDATTTVAGARPVGPVTVTVPRLEIPGIHRFIWTPARATSSLWKLVAVNHDDTEVDLSKVPPAEATKLLADWQPEIVTNFNQATLFRDNEHDAGAGQKHDFAAGILIVLLALLLGESFLSNRFYRGDDSEIENKEVPAEQKVSYVTQDN